MAIKSLQYSVNIRAVSMHVAGIFICNVSLPGSLRDEALSERKNDDSLTWSMCDVYLHKDCYNFRVPSAPLSAYVSVNEQVNATKSPTTTDGIVLNASLLMCYVYLLP